MAELFSNAFAFPLMLTELAVASWETVWHRTALIATGACTNAEYEQMMQEKVNAVHLSRMALMSGHQVQEVLRPFHVRATANAKRLRPA